MLSNVIYYCSVHSEYLKYKKIALFYKVNLIKCCKNEDLILKIKRFKPKFILVDKNFNKKNQFNYSHLKINTFFISDTVDYELKYISEDLAINYLKLVNFKNSIQKCYSNDDLFENIMVVIDDLLMQYGFNPKHIGMRYLKDVIESKIINGDKFYLSTICYPLIAKRYQKSVESIERSIRSAINSAWNKREIVGCKMGLFANKPKISDFINFLIEDIFLIYNYENYNYYISLMNKIKSRFDFQI